MSAPRWLALGDSYTIGEGVAAHERWPVRLAGLLGLGPPRLVATTGWTTHELLAGMEAAPVWPPTERYELVTLLIGVNDQYRGAAYAAGAYAACVERACALAHGEAARVLGLSIPDWGVTRFAAGRDRRAIAGAIDDWNALERAHLGSLGAHWCDITALSRRHGDDPGFLAEDGLHPGAAAYIEWAHMAAPQARLAVAGRAPGG